MGITLKFPTLRPANQYQAVALDNPPPMLVKLDFALLLVIFRIKDKVGENFQISGQKAAFLTNM